MGRPAIVGTAGHIDHGKTALIRALTGQDTDRLKEEKERGISIDLGFAYLQLDDGRRVGIVDVPGHERFVRNMLAGAHGIDLVLFTVAADDGVMPQTEEHLDILHCLGVRAGVFVVTKADLVDARRLAEVREDIEILSVDTSLEGIPIVPVSSVTGAGLDELRQEITRQLERQERPPPRGYFRLPVDRIFVMRGHGAVVTGTAIAGRVVEGQAVRVLPGGAEARVRGVQVHGLGVESAGASERVALNLGGVESGEISRGQVICDLRLTRATDRFDAFVEVRPGARQALRSHRRVRVHVGTADVLARVVVLGDLTRLEPRMSGYCQFALDDPVVALGGDRFIIRDETARWTLGGGEVVDAFARRHGSERAEASRRLERLRTASVPVAVETWVSMQKAPVVAVEEIVAGLNLSEEDVRAAVCASPALRGLPDSASPEACTTASWWETVRAAVVAAVDDAHRRSPLARGAEVEALRGQLCGEMPVRYFRVLIDDTARSGELVREEGWVRRATHRAALSGSDRDAAERAVALIEAGGFTPPDMAQVAARLGESPERLAEVLAVVEAEGRLVRVAPDLFYAPGPFAAARDLLVGRLGEAGEISAAVFRDLLGASRRYSIALLDHFDRAGVTLRVGDIRKLRQRN